jgi:folate-binding protein YgfZ
MLSNDVAALAPGRERSGCYAALLTPQGRIVADLHVLLRDDAFWLEMQLDRLPAVAERLERYIVADDVRLADWSARFARLGVEGPRATAVLEAAAGAPLALAPDSCCDARLGGIDAVVAAFGWSGEAAFQVFAPAASAEALRALLMRAGEPHGLVRCGPEALEILRIEAGVPRLGRELGEDVLPAEARLERAISRSKGCYTGQEIVARIESRGRVKHLLVGLRLEGSAAPDPGAPVCAGSERVGEITSACLSPSHGPIALAYVRRPHDEAGGELDAAGRAARVCALPFA